MCIRIEKLKHLYIFFIYVIKSVVQMYEHDKGTGELKVDWRILSFFLKDFKNQFVVTVTSQSHTRNHQAA